MGFVEEADVCGQEAGDLLFEVDVIGPGEHVQGCLGGVVSIQQSGAQELRGGVGLDGRLNGADNRAEGGFVQEAWAEDARLGLGEVHDG